MNQATEDQILSMLKDPKRRDEGFTLLVDAYQEQIYWHIRRLVVSHEDAEDVLQETFINVYRFASSFNGSSKIYTYLYRIATNECMRLFRKNRSRKQGQAEISEKLVRQLAEESAESSDNILLKFQQAILQLPEKQRIVFNLRYYDELSYEEMSQVLDSSVGSLKTNYHYAVEKIKNYLKIL